VALGPHGGGKAGGGVAGAAVAERGAPRAVLGDASPRAAGGGVGSARRRHGCPRPGRAAPPLPARPAARARAPRGGGRRRGPPRPRTPEGPPAAAGGVAVGSPGPVSEGSPHAPWAWTEDGAPLTTGRGEELSAPRACVLGTDPRRAPLGTPKGHW
jgi:hypothetical protein